MSLFLSFFIAALPTPVDPVRVAIDKGIKRLEASATSYIKNRNCFSCHHQAITVKSLTTARDRGFAIDEEILKKQVSFTADFFKAKIKSMREGTGIGGANTTAAYALFTLEAGKHARDETTDALIEFLLKKQDNDGGWTPTTIRPPTESSKLTIVALALQTLQAYSPDQNDEPDFAERNQTAMEEAYRFLKNAKPITHEDRVFRLHGLVSAGAGQGIIDEAKQALLKKQRADGGWAQLDGANHAEVPDPSAIVRFFTSRTARSKHSDAYATATALVALRMAGTSPRDIAYQKGVAYLLKSQHESGGWVVMSRSNPIQLLFDNGDPGGARSGFISTQATGWAVLALLECCDKK